MPKTINSLTSPQRQFFAGECGCDCSPCACHEIDNLLPAKIILAAITKNLLTEQNKRATRLAGRNMGQKGQAA